MRQSFCRLLEDNGYVLLRNVYEEFDPVAFCKDLGDFVPQYTGVLVGDVVPEPGMDAYYHAGNSKPLLPHSEGYDFAGLPPRYLALWCVKPAHGSGGETTLADAYAWVSTLTEEERTRLLERVYEWTTTDAVRSMGLTLSSRHPILEQYDGRLIVRFSYNNLVRDASDEFTERILAGGKEFFYRAHVAIDYCQYDMLVLDNWRMLHARNAFTDQGRHLRRIQIGPSPVAG
jgi:alpha-ketoglutarate-dependent taurine dioxygenase